MAHIGVLQWLEEHRIPVDRISGTSMGSLIGALYATGSTPAQMRAVAVSDAFTRVFTLQTPYSELSFRRRQDRHELPAALTVGLRHHLFLRNGLLTDRGVNEFLTTYLPNDNNQELDYNQLPIPFRCVATDLNTLASVTYASGPLPQAVRASISIPGVFSPVQDRNGHYLVDGGILDNLPTGVLKRDLHAGVIIAIHLEDAAISKTDTNSALGVLNRAFDAGIQRNVIEAERLADVVVSVPVGNFSGSDYARAAPLIDAGYKAAEQNRAALLRYALDADGWKAYLDARESRRSPRPGILRQVRVEGGKPGAVHEVLADMKPIEGRPIEPASTIQRRNQRYLGDLRPSARARRAARIRCARPQPAHPNSAGSRHGHPGPPQQRPHRPALSSPRRRICRCQLQHHPWHGYSPPGRSESRRLRLRAARQRTHRL
jgi:NTE family protein